MILFFLLYCFVLIKKHHSNPQIHPFQRIPHLIPLFLYSIPLFILHLSCHPPTITYNENVFLFPEFQYNHDYFHFCFLVFSLFSLFLLPIPSRSIFPFLLIYQKQICITHIETNQMRKVSHFDLAILLFKLSCASFSSLLPIFLLLYILMI